MTGNISIPELIGNYTSRKDYLQKYCQIRYQLNKKEYKKKAKEDYKENKEEYIGRAKNHYRLNTERHKLLTVLNRRAKKLMLSFGLEERVAE